MRQLITRIDDELHALLKHRARAEGRSVNAVVTEAIKGAVRGTDDRAHLLARLSASGRRVVPPRPPRMPRPETIDELSRGAGTAVSEALGEERAAR